MKRRVGTLLAALLAAMGGVFIADTPAEASLSQCQSGYFCGWDYNNYQGTIWRLSYDTIFNEHGWSFYNRGYNNVFGSVYNHTGLPMVLYDSTTCNYGQTNGYFLYVPSGVSDDFGVDYTYFNNIAGSVTLQGYTDQYTGKSYYQCD